MQHISSFLLAKKGGQGGKALASYTIFVGKRPTPLRMGLAAACIMVVIDDLQANLQWCKGENKRDGTYREVQ